MNDYEARQEAKRDRLHERADRAEGKATAAHKTARRISDAIPLGQPVLVGHHSEGRHRRDLDRMGRGYATAHDEAEKAARLRARAEGLGTHGVSADDPEAVRQLKEKLARQESSREQIKAVNKTFRKAKGGEPGWAAVREMIGDEQTTTLIKNTRFTREDVPFPRYELTNLGADIRRVKERIKTLEVEAARPEAAPVEHEGFQVIERQDINRVTVEFDAKPPREVCAIMRSNGFRWSPREGAWMRQLNANGRAAAKRAAEEIAKYLPVAT